MQLGAQLDQDEDEDVSPDLLLLFLELGGSPVMTHWGPHKD